MRPCQLTSRIKQAIGAMQLFVQRCLMNLEAGVSAPARPRSRRWREWTWMRNYRVWEANRKVFLYPENWIEPELRDDKSPFFQDLESELLQSELSQTPTDDIQLKTADPASRLPQLPREAQQVARPESSGKYHQSGAFDSFRRHGEPIVDPRTSSAALRHAPDLLLPPLG